MEFLPMPHHVTHGDGCFQVKWNIPVRFASTSSARPAAPSLQSKREYIVLRGRGLLCREAPSLALPSEEIFVGEILGEGPLL